MLIKSSRRIRIFCSEVELSNYYVQQFYQYDAEEAIHYISPHPSYHFSSYVDLHELFNNIQSIIKNATPVIIRLKNLIVGMGKNYKILKNELTEIKKNIKIDLC